MTALVLLYASSLKLHVKENLVTKQHSFPWWLFSDSKVSVRNAGHQGSIPRLGRSPGIGNVNPLQYSCLRQLTRKVSDAGKNWRQKEKRASEDEMAGQHYWCNKHESNWANSRRWWGTRRPGMLQSMGLQRVRHDWATEQQQPPNELGSWENSVLF